MAKISSNAQENNFSADSMDSGAKVLDAKFAKNLRIEDGSSERIAADDRCHQPPIMEKHEEKSAGLTNADTGNVAQNGNPELRQCMMFEKRKQLNSAKDVNLPISAEAEAITQQDDKSIKPVAFSIPIENCLPSRQPHIPKRLCNAKKIGKASIETLNKKQALAEERRQHYKENRLKRIHERQEACRKLAQNVDTLLQQRALTQDMVDGTVRHMPPNEILATAHLVSRNFRALTNQLGNDLTVKDKEKESSKECQNENQITRVSCSQEKYPSSVSFTVSCDCGNRPVKPMKLTPKKQQKKKRILTSEDLEEKQRQAEERRNKKKELRAQRVRENREAFLAMALDIEKFEKLQSATASSPNKDGNLAEQNMKAALLAEKLANQFDRLNKRYSEDLKRAENFQVSHSMLYLGP